MSCCGRITVCSQAWYNLCACAVNGSYDAKCNKKPLDFGFVDKLRAIEPAVVGQGNQWRFKRLLHSSIYFQLVSYMSLWPIDAESPKSSLSLPACLY